MRGLLLILILASTAWGVGSSSPRRTDLRYFSLGGAYTALIDHPLMAYYNPAGYAFLGRSSRQNLFAMDDDDFVRPRAVSPIRVGLPSFTLSLSTGAYSNIAGVRSLIDLVMPGANLGLPAPFDTIASALGLGQLIVPSSNAAAFSLSGMATNLGSVTNLINPLVGLGFRFGLDAALLAFELRGFSFGLDLMFDASLGLAAHNEIIWRVPVPELHLENNLAFWTAFGFRLNTEIPMSVGFTAKVFNRALVAVDTDNKLLALIGDQDALIGAVGAVAGNPLSLITGQASLGTASNYMRIGTGVSVDTGFLIQPIPHFWAGAMLRDTAGMIIWLGASNEWLVPSLDLGVVWSPPISAVGFFENPLIALSFSDVWGKNEEPVFKRIHAGLEFGTFFDAIRLRAGIHEGYPSFSAQALINTRFLSKVPFLKLLFPREPISLLLWPQSWDYAGLLDFWRRNLVVWTGSLVMRLLSLFDIHVEGGYYGLENSVVPGGSPDWQAALAVRLDFKTK